MTIKVLKNETFSSDSDLPKRATSRSTGNDIIATSDPEIVGVKNSAVTGEFWKSIDYIQYRTNLFTSVQMDLTDYDILGFPRSSISKYNLVLANSICLIDADYRGEVILRFKYIWQPEDFLYVPTCEVSSTGNYSEISGKITGKPNLEKIYKKGDKICQLKITRVEGVRFHLTENLDETVRGTGAFGSTDTYSSDLMEKFKLKTQESVVSKRYLDNIREREKQFI